jgi:hypothetical protein
MVEGEAIYVEGIGHIGQYLNYLDCLWEKGVPYFVRDYYVSEIALQTGPGHNAEDASSLISKVNRLNSDIVSYERFIGPIEWHHRHQISQNSTRGMSN